MKCVQSAGGHDEPGVSLQVPLAAKVGSCTRWLKNAAQPAVFIYG